MYSLSLKVPLGVVSVCGYTLMFVQGMSLCYNAYVPIHISPKCSISVHVEPYLIALLRCVPPGEAAVSISFI